MHKKIPELKNLDSMNFPTSRLYCYWLYHVCTVLSSEWWKYVVVNPWNIRITLQCLL